MSIAPTDATSAEVWASPRPGGGVVLGAPPATAEGAYAAQPGAVVRRVHPARERLSPRLARLLRDFAICDGKHHPRMDRVDGHLRRRLRALLLKQWKRKRHIVNRLKQMGVPAPLVHVDVHARRRSWWALSKVRAVSRGLNNEYFERRGRFALHAHWRGNHERIWDIGFPCGREDELRRKLMMEEDPPQASRATRSREEHGRRQRHRPEEPDVRPISPVL